MTTSLIHNGISQSIIPFVPQVGIIYNIDTSVNPAITLDDAYRVMKSNNFPNLTDEQFDDFLEEFIYDPKLADVEEMERYELFITYINILWDKTHIEQTNCRVVISDNILPLR